MRASRAQRQRERISQLMPFRIVPDAIKMKGAFDHVQPSYVGSMGAVICSYCQAKKWPGESAGLCCGSGRVVLPPLEKPPNLIHELLTGNHRKSAHFREHARLYNAAFNLVSSSARVEKRFPDGPQAFHTGDFICGVFFSKQPVTRKNPHFRD